MFKFNGGAGAIICDKCRIIIDEGFDDFMEAERIYGKVTYCRDCRQKLADNESNDHSTVVDNPLIPD
jgi:hypothetical protein